MPSLPWMLPCIVVLAPSLSLSLSVCLSVSQMLCFSLSQNHISATAWTNLFLFHFCVCVLWINIWDNEFLSMQILLWQRLVCLKGILSIVYTKLGSHEWNWFNLYQFLTNLLNTYPFRHYSIEYLLIHMIHWEISILSVETPKGVIEGVSYIMKLCSVC